MTPQQKAQLVRNSDELKEFCIKLWSKKKSAIHIARQAALHFKVNISAQFVKRQLIKMGVKF